MTHDQPTVKAYRILSIYIYAKLVFKYISRYLPVVYFHMYSLKGMSLKKFIFSCIF